MQKTIKPTFNFKVILLRVLSRGSPFTIYLLSVILLGLIKTSPVSKDFFVYLFSIFFLYLIISSVIILFIKISYNNTQYVITDKSITYRYDFLWITKKEVTLVNIKEVEFNSSILQKLGSLGSVLLNTHASTGRNSLQASTGLNLKDIEHPEEIYELIKTEIAKTNQS